MRQLHARRGRLAVGAAVVWLLAARWTSTWPAVVSVLAGAYGVLELGIGLAGRRTAGRRTGGSPDGRADGDGGDPVLAVLLAVLLAGVVVLVVDAV